MDINDFSERQLALLPPWFGDAAPLLAGVLQGSAFCNEFIYSLQIYLRAQMRLQTMTDNSLDLFARDYFGNNLVRHFGEDDATYRLRISNSLLPPGATRQAMIDVLTNLTGRVPIIWESGMDSGFYDHMFLDHTNGGTDNDAYQAWIIAYRPLTPNIAGVSYYNQTYFYNNSFYSGLISTSVTDQDILDAIQRTKCEGTLMHVTILD
jgi:hypothetical protein